MKQFDVNEFFDYVRNDKYALEFLKHFGGNFSYCPEFCFVYEHGDTMYFMGGHNFVKDIKKSVKTNQNILLTYSTVHW